MSLIKKNIIMSNKQQKNSKLAYLTLEESYNGITAILSTQNITQKAVNLAISANGAEVFNQRIQLKGGKCEFLLNKHFTLSSDINCIIVEINDNQVVPLAWSSPKIPKFEYNTSALNHIDNEDVQHQESSLKKDENSKIDLTKLFEDNQDELEDLIDDTLSDSTTTPDSQFLLHTNKVFETDVAELAENIKDGEIFYDLIANQVQDLFSKYPAQEELETLIPNSKWIVVNYDSQPANEYVLGLIYDEVNLKYICYGIPGEFSANPPKSVEPYSQWLPLNPSSPASGGYWVMYQDAITGDSLLVDTI